MQGLIFPSSVLLGLMLASETGCAAIPWMLSGKLWYIPHCYSLAPLIVARIDKPPNRTQLYRTVYDELVAPCVKLIEESHMQDAWKLYRAYTTDLISRYGVNAA